MSVQEVMNLVRQYENLNRYGFAMFILIAVVALVGLTINVNHHINRKPWIIAQTSCCVLAGLLFCGFIKLGDVQSNISHQISKKVTEKKTIKYTHWEQSENGDYYFGEYRVAEDNVSVTKHHPKLSKPYAKVKTTYISNRFTKSQKTKIYKALNITDTKRLGNKATINK